MTQVEGLILKQYFIKTYGGDDEDAPCEITTVTSLRGARKDRKEIIQL